MDPLTCIKSRRSIRKFTPQPVSHELLEQIVNAAAFAPSWKNTQIARYLAIETREQIDRIAQEYTPPFNRNILNRAPLLVALTAIKKRAGYERDGSFSTDRGDGWQMFDCGIAAQTFCLAAAACGIGTVILGVFDRPGLEAYLKLPEERELVALIAAGYPDETPQPPKRKAAGELLSYL